MRNAVMGFLYLQRDWSYPELGHASNQNHKRVKRDLALLSQGFFDGLPSSAEPSAVSTAAAKESGRTISLLPPARFKGTRIMG
jgi:hypothetical protein